MDAPMVAEWTIGPSLGISHIQLDEAVTEPEAAIGPSPDEDGKSVEGPAPRRIPVTSDTSPYPHVNLPQVGRVTGTVRLFEDKISGGKSDERGASNGFHVSVLGRVVNRHDPSFGEENLNHAAWSRFRMAVRADGLNEYLTTNREQFREHSGMRIFRAFLRKAFNPDYS